jgi:hypothetical protein
MTSTARRVSSAANPEQAANATLSSVNAVFTLSLILTQARSPRQAVRLLTTAVPSIVSCHKVLTWHPNRSGDYYERAPDGISNALARITAPGRLEMDESSSWWAFPFAPALAQNPIFLVVAGTDPLSGQEKFLLSVLAQLCGTVIAKLELVAAERANIERVASLNADLASTVSTLTKIMETHRQLNEIVANAGEAGIAKTLHQLTRFPVLIQDVHGNTRAAAGDVPGHRRAKEQLDYDKRHRSDLLATLAQYFDSGCNIDQAAAVLSIHRSTLKYRLKRVRELLGQDLNDGSTRLDLHLATRVWLTLESLRRTEQA